MEHFDVVKMLLIWQIENYSPIFTSFLESALKSISAICATHSPSLYFILHGTICSVLPL